MRLDIYRAEDGWRWRIVARNGRIVADSAESYRRRVDCVRMATKVAAGGFPVVLS